MIDGVLDEKTENYFEIIDNKAHLRRETSNGETVAIYNDLGLRLFIGLEEVPTINEYQYRLSETDDLDLNERNIYRTTAETEVTVLAGTYPVEVLTFENESEFGDAYDSYIRVSFANPETFGELHEACGRIEDFVSTAIDSRTTGGDSCLGGDKYV